MAAILWVVFTVMGVRQGLLVTELLVVNTTYTPGCSLLAAPEQPPLTRKRTNLVLNGSKFAVTPASLYHQGAVLFNMLSEEMRLIPTLRFKQHVLTIFLVFAYWC